MPRGRCAEPAFRAVQNAIPGGLPGRPNATIRSPAAARIGHCDPGSAWRHRSLKALIAGLFAVTMRNGSAATRPVAARPAVSLPSSIG